MTALYIRAVTEWLTRAPRHSAPTSLQSFYDSGVSTTSEKTPREELGG